MRKILVAIGISLLITSVGCSGNASSENGQSVEVIVDVDAKQFKDLLGKEEGTVLDVRTPEEWAEGTIPNAVKMNYHDDNFEMQVEELDKEKPVFVYCKKGGRSSSAADILEEKGFKKVYNLDGGISAWNDEGFETSK